MQTANQFCLEEQITPVVLAKKLEFSMFVCVCMCLCAHMLVRIQSLCEFEMVHLLASLTPPPPPPPHSPCHSLTHKGFGVAAKSTQDCRHADPTSIVAFHQADTGEYLRCEDTLT